MAVTLPPPRTGRRIVLGSWAGTVALTVSAVPAAVEPHLLQVPALVVAIGLFAGGLGVLVASYVIAVGRSRSEELTVLGIYGLSESAPTRVKAHLFGSLGAEAIVALLTAASHPYSSLAFGVLAVMWGVGMAGLWGARHGAFPPRRPPESPRRRKAG